MLKLLLVLLTYATPAKTYDVRGLGRVTPDGASCGAISRMLKDKHTLKVYEDKVTINGMKWEVVHEAPDLIISFHENAGQKTFLYMDLYVNEAGLFGKYMLFGLTAKRELCFDAVYVNGTRR